MYAICYMITEILLFATTTATNNASAATTSAAAAAPAAAIFCLSILCGLFSQYLYHFSRFTPFLKVEYFRDWKACTDVLL